MEENYAQAACRHIKDAEYLLADMYSNRIDNVVYLLGYVVECTFKVLIEYYVGRSVAISYGHRLSQLEKEAMDRIRMLHPEIDTKIPRSQIENTVLEQYHPERRYAATGMWSMIDGEEALRVAKEIYNQVIIEMVLDGQLPSRGTIL